MKTLFAEQFDDFPAGQIVHADFHAIV